MAMTPTTRNILVGVATAAGISVMGVGGNILVTAGDLHIAEVANKTVDKRISTLEQKVDQLTKSNKEQSDSQKTLIDLLKQQIEKEKQN